MFSSKNKESKKMAKNNNPATTSNSVSTIANGTSIVGEIKSEGNYRIDGTLKGNISVTEKLIIGPTGYIEGNISCTNSDVSGKISGKIVVKELLSLVSTASIKGDIVTKKLSIEPGAIFTGTCNMDNNVNGKKEETKK